MTRIAERPAPNANVRVVAAVQAWTAPEGGDGSTLDVKGAYVGPGYRSPGVDADRPWVDGASLFGLMPP